MALLRLTGGRNWVNTLAPLYGRMGFMDGTKRSDIKVGLRVAIVLKQDQRSGKLTEGVVQAVLTKSATHPHGIKVRLQSGAVGRVKAILG